MPSSLEPTPPTNLRWLTAEDAGNLCPRPRTAETVRKWMKTGMRGVKLRHIFDGKNYLTTEEWLETFQREIAPESNHSFSTKTKEEVLREFDLLYG